MELPTREMLCSCKLFYDTGDDDYPYCFCGSGFLIRFRDIIYLVTLRHCVDPARYTRVCVPVDPCDHSNRDLLAFDLVSTPKGDPQQDVGKNYADLLLFRSVAPDISRPVFEIASDTLLNPLSSGVTRVFVRGFPSDINEIDFDQHKIKTRAFFSEGFSESIKNDAVAEHCYSLRINKPREISSTQGMSGCPVFALDPRSHTKLLGVVYQGGTGDTISFIGIEVLFSMLKRL